MQRFAMTLRAVAATALALAVMGSVVAPQPVMADETGLASIHAWRKVGKKTCLSGHDHQGSGTGTSQKAAQLAAIRSWASFTDFEYGKSWANFNLAVEKRMTCEASGSSYSCSLSAVPCRGW
jgi:hypothetical protein